jgi:hypothetical protein
MDIPEIHTSSDGRGRRGQNVHVLDAIVSVVASHDCLFLRLLVTIVPTDTDSLFAMIQFNCNSRHEQQQFEAYLAFQGATTAGTQRL